MPAVRETKFDERSEKDPIDGERTFTETEVSLAMKLMLLTLAGGLIIFLLAIIAFFILS